MKSSCKDAVLALLETRKGIFVSGGDMARELGVTRNAIWRAIESLKKQGYGIEAVTGKGYRLESKCSILSKQCVERYLCSSDITVEFHESVDSTNTRLKALAEQGAPEGTLFIAGEQSSGKGRRGRPFFSPAGTGIYFSLLLRPDFRIEDLALITTYTAVVASRAIEALFERDVRIKWVNDLFVEDRKIAGILTEAAFSAEGGQVDYVVVGIGIDVFAPEDGFPEHLNDVVGPLSPLHTDTDDIRARLIARITDDFMGQYHDIPSRPHLAEYRKRSLLDGRSVIAQMPDGTERVEVLGVDDDFALEVLTESGETRHLNHSEVSIPSSSL